MVYFIPAWYAPGEWRENEQIWYTRRMQTEMDDTVKQIQLFHRTAKYPYEILLLGHTPNFRHFLHRQGVFNAPYWSCFDAIGCIRTHRVAVLSFHDFDWPENVEFIYSPFAVLAKVNGRRYAQVEFGEDGNPIREDFFEDDGLIRRNRYDDRGFIGCISYYNNGKQTYEEYPDEAGTWKIRVFADGHVEVNPESSFYLLYKDNTDIFVPYMQKHYASLEDVIAEVTRSYFSLIPMQHIFCAAMHDRHMGVLSKLLPGRKSILSFWTGRSYGNDPVSLARLLESADYIIADSQQNLEQLSREANLPKNRMMEITPYDTRVDFGISLQQHDQKILVPVDNLSDSDFEQMVVSFAVYMQKNTFARVHLFTRNALYDRQDKLLEKTRAILEKNGFDSGYARKPSNQKAEFFLDKEDQLPILFLVDQCVEELSASKCAREQRLMVDLSPTPDLFLQILCISMGIPQIVRKETRYVEVGKNGRLNESFATLTDDVDFYLSSLANWNAAMIGSYELGEQYTSVRLASQWKEVISEIENYTGPSAGGK